MSKRRKKQQTNKPAPAVAELIKHGWCRRDAEHLVLIEMALSTVRTVGTDAARVLAEYAATALAWEPVKCGVNALYLEPEHAAAWRALAGHQEHSGMRQLMLRLAAECDGYEVVDRSTAEWTAEDLRLTGLASEAECRGEFAEALRLLSLSHRPLDDAWRRDLERVLSYGAQMTPAQWGRWICSAALRWCQSTTRGLDLGISYASIALRALGASEEVVQAQAPPRAGYDQVVHDALLFDEGGLRMFLEHELAPVLADKVPGLAAWADAPLVVVRLVARTERGALCEDVLDGQSCLVGDELLGDQHPAGRLFIGRLVRIDGGDRQFFATLPTVVDEECTALELAAAVRAGADAGARIDLIHRRLSSEAA